MRRVWDKNTRTLGVFLPDKNYLSATTHLIRPPQFNIIHLFVFVCCCQIFSGCCLYSNRVRAEQQYNRDTTFMGIQNFDSCTFSLLSMFRLYNNVLQHNFKLPIDCRLQKYFDYRVSSIDDMMSGPNRGYGHSDITENYEQF